MKRSTEWLSENVGRELKFAFGAIEYSGKLEYNNQLNYYFFKVMGIEHDARICKIYD